MKLTHIDLPSLDTILYYYHCAKICLLKKHQHAHTMLVSSWAVPADAMTCLCSSLFCWLLATLLTKATVKDRKLNKEAVSSELFPQPLLFSKAKITVFIF